MNTSSFDEDDNVQNPVMNTAELELSNQRLRDLALKGRVLREVADMCPEAEKLRSDE